MRQGSFPTNGATYDPTHRAAVWDFVPKHHPHKHCTPHYPSDANPDDLTPYHNPVVYYYTAIHYAPGNVNPTPYHGKLYADRPSGT